ncbi:MAG: HPr family phosphocarrier protein [Planctomycetes bacterium]|nr:HPr family phosphocarrier protein [Planctomycetota bacterium]
MTKEQVIIGNSLGLHARPAMTFVQCANAFVSTVRVRRCDAAEWVDGKSIMQMLLLAATCGSQIEIECTGNDEQSALDALLALVNRRFDEE